MVSRLLGRNRWPTVPGVHYPEKGRRGIGRRGGGGSSASPLSTMRDSSLAWRHLPPTRDGCGRRTSAETDPDRDRAIDRLTAVTPSCAGISCLMGVERRACVVRTYSPIQDCIGPIAMTTGPSSSSPTGMEPHAQEGPFWSLPVGVLPVCVWSCLFLKRPLLLPLPP
jgi:hypothetical protein